MRAGKFPDIDAQHINQHIHQASAQPGGHGVGEKIKFMPIGHILGKPFFRFDFECKVVVVDVSGLPHHGKQILRMMRAVRIFGGIAIGMVHPVQNCIGPGRQVRASLTDPGENVKEPLPELAHLEHLVRCVAVQKEALAK